MKNIFESDRIVPPEEGQSRFAAMRETMSSQELLDKLEQEQLEAVQDEMQSKRGDSKSVKKIVPRKVEVSEGPNTGAAAMQRWEEEKNKNERVMN